MTIGAVAIIVAAGMGRRLGQPGPKAWTSVAGRPLLVWTLRALDRWPRWNRWIIVHPADLPPEARQTVENQLDTHPPIEWVPGGVRRQDSVWNGLQRLVHHEPQTVVMVHDAARPLVPPDLIERLWTAVQRVGAVVPVVPISETVKRIDNARIVETLDRTRLYISQTPQAFYFDVLWRAYQTAQREGRVVTDEAAAVEALGLTVLTVPGYRWNFKITYPEDLAWFAEWVRVERLFPQ